MSKIPQSYRPQNGCHNCKHVFVYKEHDCSPSYFCTLGAPPRPSSMSVQLGEYPLKYDHDLQNQMHEAWDDWSSEREVEEHGICDEWWGETSSEND